jgi:uncharacterized membrane protein
MKPVIIIFIFSLIIGTAMGGDFAQANSDQEKRTTLKADNPMAYLQAVKTGDVETIKQLLSDEDYKAYRVMLEQNSAYPDFLRQPYKGVTFQVTDEGNSHYLVEITFPDGHKEMHKFAMQGGA